MDPTEMDNAGGIGRPTLTPDDLKTGADETVAYLATTLATRLSEVTASMNAYVRYIGEIQRELAIAHAEIASLLDGREDETVVQMPSRPEPGDDAE